MPTIDIAGVSGEIPDNWNCQGMLTLTLPSADQNVKPNVIVTKEYLPREVELGEYFEKIKESIKNRGIKDLKVGEEREIVVSGVRGKMMVCSWDVSSMAAMLQKERPDQPIPDHIKPGQMVKQIQVTLLKDKLAINMTASFPDDQFEVYYRPFQQFLKSMKIEE